MLSRASRLYDQTIIMVTHDREVSEYADRIIRIADGVVRLKDRKKQRN